MTTAIAPLSFALPNGLTVFGLNLNDTLTVYHDIFDDDCYRLHGVTINDGDCILDVGANTGLFILFLNKIGVNARVWAFEPVPAIFEVLKRNVDQHNTLDVQLFNVGLSRETGPATFTYYPRFSNASTQYPDESAEGALRGRQYIIDQIPTVRQPWQTVFRDGRSSAPTRRWRAASSVLPSRLTATSLLCNFETCAAARTNCTRRSLLFGTVRCYFPASILPV